MTLVSPLDQNLDLHQLQIFLLLSQAWAGDLHVEILMRFERSIEVEMLCEEVLQKESWYLAAKLVVLR